MRRNVLSIISTLSLASVTQTRQASGLTRNLMISSRPLSYNTLIVSTTADAASLNIANALKESCSQWETYLTTEISSVYCTKAAPSLSESILSDHLVWLWVQNQPLLHLNNVDLLLNEELVSCGTAAERTNESIIFNEVIFLSKHCAASGKASLTVHPIGIPWMVDASDSGGFPGRCSPPNRRIAELYRLVLAETKSRNMQDRFEVTLEATHHGPYVALPVCFVEIGSTEAEWSIPEAGLVWADCLLRHFGIPLNTLSDSSSSSSSSSSSNSSGDRGGTADDSGNNGVVLVTIGGGHYVPKMNDAARFGPGMFTGHSLATYTLQRHLDGTERSPVDGGWQHIVNEALASTRITYPTAELIVLLDKKAFIANHKNDIIALLDDNGVKWTHKVSDVKLLWEKIMQKPVACDV